MQVLPIILLAILAFGCESCSSDIYYCSFTTKVRSPLLQMWTLFFLGIFAFWLRRRIAELEHVLRKIQLSTHRLAVESPLCLRDQSNSIIGLEDDVCAIRRSLGNIEKALECIERSFECIERAIDPV